MALKADRYEESTDISFFYNEGTATRGGAVVLDAALASGAAMDQGGNKVKYGTAGVPVGILLNDVVNKDLTRTHHFQEELVEQFLQCLGVYPTGSLVEMHSGEVAIVMAQNKTRRMSPQIMLLLDKDKKPYAEYQIINLMNQPSEYDQNPLMIFRGIDPGSYGIDPTEFYL